jgi:hypothetical protein
MKDNMTPTHEECLEIAEHCKNGEPLPVRSTDWLEIQIRYRISQKEFLTAQANQDNSLGGWRMDYAREQNVIDSEIEQLIKDSNDMATVCGIDFDRIADVTTIRSMELVGFKIQRRT